MYSVIINHNLKEDWFNKPKSYHQPQTEKRHQCLLCFSTYTADIQFHDTLHGFLTGRSTGNAYLKAKKIHQLMDMREEALYDIFLDPHKSYD